MVLSLSILGVILSTILVVFNARNFSSSVYLGAFFFLISFYGFIQYVLLTSDSVFLLAIVFANVGFPTYLIGPILYFYVRSLLRDNSRLAWYDLFHLVPMLIYVVLIIPYVFTPWAFKMDLARQLIERSHDITHFNFKLVSIYQYIPTQIVYLSRPVLILGYLIWSGVLLCRYSFSPDKSVVFYQQQFIRKWLWILMGFLFVLVLSHAFQVMLAFNVMNATPFNTLNLVQVINALGMIGLLISPFFFPHILYGIPRLPASIVQSGNGLPEPVSEKQKANGSKYETEYIGLIGHKTETCMTEFEPYLQQDFNLTQLSVLINIPVHHLAYYFREVKKRSFTDYRNEWRIQHAKKLISAGKTTEMTLEAIGMLSGFFSRSTFISAFKKVEGITPGEYASRSKS